MAVRVETAAVSRHCWVCIDAISIHSADPLNEVGQPAYHAYHDGDSQRVVQPSLLAGWAKNDGCTEGLTLRLQQPPSGAG